MTTNWILIGVLVAILVAFIFISMSRRKKETEYRAELESKILPGAKVKTYSGLYGTVVSVTDTTDGKIVLIKTGEGSNISYQSLHINAIFGFDTKQPLRYDKEGNVILPKDLSSDGKEERKNVPIAPILSEIATDKNSSNKTKTGNKETATTKKTTPAKKEEKVEDKAKGNITTANKTVAKKATTTKKPTAKKSSSTATKKPTAKKNTNKKPVADKK